MDLLDSTASSYNPTFLNTGDTLTYLDISSTSAVDGKSPLYNMPAIGEMLGTEIYTFSFDGTDTGLNLWDS